MTDQPVIDGRSRDRIRDRILEMAPYYVEEWNPDRGGPGRAVVELFADMTADVVERLDRVPEKHQAAFLDALDFEPHPPEPSMTPVQFTLDETATETATVTPGTTVTAAGTDARPQQQFETVSDRRFEATPARLTDAFGSDPGTDRIVDHSQLCADEGSAQLFTGPDCQAHEFYLGDDTLLGVEGGSVVTLEVETTASERVLRDVLEWEFYGDPEDGEEGWHPLTVVEGRDRSGASLSEFQQVETFVRRQERYLETRGYELDPTDPDYDLLIRALADDTLEGRFGGDADRNGSTDPLPPGLFEGSDVDGAVRDRLVDELGDLQRRLQSTATSTRFGGDPEPVELTLRVPGEPTERAVDGTESRWIRCRIPDDELATPLFEVLVESVRVSVGSDRRSASTGNTPDAAVANDLVVEFDDSGVAVLGETPTETATFNIASEEAFTKPGATVTVTFEGDRDPVDPDADPELVWEYWNGDGWRRLSVDDGTDDLQQAGQLRFEVPADLEPTSVLGHEYHWVRTRLVAGHYGEARMTETSDNTWERTTDQVSPPEYDTVTVEYSREDVPLDHLVTHNNRTYERATPGDGFRPFEPAPGDDQSLYLGFDRPLRDGPVHLYFPLAETTYPHAFSPRVTVEYHSGPPGDEWTRLNLRDGTAALTERGILAFSVPRETEASTLFGRERHWIRVSMAGDEFARTETGLFARRDGAAGSAGPEKLSTASITQRERTARTRTPPVLDGVYPNTAWAENRTTVENEPLGSSDGTADQTFEFADAPVLGAEVWVDELGSLSKRERRRLDADESTAVRTETDADGTVTAFEVRWTEVSNFFESNASSRAYVLSRSAGTVTFGDGKRGSIPPSGENNVVATYRTGGGTDGNVAAGAVTGLDDNIDSVDEVRNPDPAENGQDQEAVSEFVSRAPEQLRHRGKPVTRDEFESIARSAAREIETVECRAGEAETGTAGHVTLLVVPNTVHEKPVPSEQLLGQVEAEMRDRAPEAVAGDPSALTVRGPNYVEVSVDATTETTGLANPTLLVDRAESRLGEFTHPLDGATDGDGWPVGTVPPPGAFTTCLERAEGIARVTDIAVTYREGERTVTLTGGEGPPDCSPDVLIYSGRHDVTVQQVGNG